MEELSDLLIEKGCKLILYQTSAVGLPSPMEAVAYPTVHGQSTIATRYSIQEENVLFKNNQLYCNQLYCNQLYCNQLYWD